MADRGIAGPRIAKLGRYEVVSELGKGAMGIVYLAKDPVIGRLVAIKTIRASGSGDEEDTIEFRERFVREAQTAGILSHPNIVTIHDIGEDPETQTSFIAMEYIEGKNLKALLADKTKFPNERVAEMVAEVAEALDYAHRKGIIHRDVKPANILITTDGKVKITDFGIAKIASSNLTTTGQFLGTPNYMSPEQVSGSPVDGRSDLFSLGVMLYELLTNRKPFQGDNLTAISYKIVHEDFTPPADLSPDVPPEFNEIAARAMAKDPWNRYQRGKDLALALYQLKAQLEERRSEEDLGTMVTDAAENVPTLKLANLREIAESGGPPPPTARGMEPASETKEVTAAAPAAEGSGSFSASGSKRAPLPTLPEAAAPTVVAPGPALPPESLPAPLARARPTVPVSPVRRKNWKMPAAAAAVVLLLVAGFFALRARRNSPPPAAPAAATAELARSREEGKRLYESGRYEESLTVLSGVVARAPNDAEARRLVGLAETAWKGSQAARTAAIASALEPARAAFAEQRFEDARDRAGEVLALDPQHAEAAKLRDDSIARIALDLSQTAFASKKYEEARDRANEVLQIDAANAEAIRLRDDSAKRIDRAAAEKRKVDAELARIRAMPKGAPRVAEKMGPAAPAGVSQNPSAPATATLRLLFESPISQGHVMVAVNDQILLRRPYSFKKKEGLFKTVEGTGTVSASIPVPTGPVTVKVWLSGPDIKPAFSTVTASMLPSETRVLKVDYSGGQLGVRVQ